MQVGAARRDRATPAALRPRAGAQRGRAGQSGGRAAPRNTPFVYAHPAACCSAAACADVRAVLLLAPPVRVPTTPQALLAAALLAALPGQAWGDLFTINPLQPRAAPGATGYFGLTWGDVPRALTPTNFTVTFPDEIVWVANDRIEIHLPGFAGAYNSFGAKAPDGVALEGGFLPYQNGITAYTRTGSAATKAATAKCIAGTAPCVPFLPVCARARAPQEVCADATCVRGPCPRCGVGPKARSAQDPREQ